MHTHKPPPLFPLLLPDPKTHTFKQLNAHTQALLQENKDKYKHIHGTHTPRHTYTYTQGHLTLKSNHTHVYRTNTTNKATHIVNTEMYTLTKH